MSQILTDWIFSADKPYQYHNDGDYQKNMDKSSNGVRGHQTKEPKDEQYHCDCIQHRLKVSC
jgi:hypothetical protein